jgi:hypothetical protein
LISKSDIGSKIDAGRYPLLALLLLVAPPAPPAPSGGPPEQADKQRSSVHFFAIADLALHAGCMEFTQSMQA